MLVIKRYKAPKSLKILLMSMLLCQGASAAEDVIVIEGAEIRGDQEQPKILYIVPWQRPGNRGGLQPNSVDIVGAGLLKPIYREEFLREVAYFQLFNPEQSGQGSTSAGTPGAEE
ncbi:hypothetical protein BTA51_11000 [Hahella sp. CCB-MM4]|uniref:hypothetical protein n=1 Tax=Hahella sp. (strain CCB-MM4) TaxID=1926491 RepID=UPI000B9ACCCB|nr:hypothetical protein [Hahella sp. CCB-MM4]OZG73531.1 hypothetical protein BTA51_11000 [Hahella sp. CCB-MM4]